MCMDVTATISLGILVPFLGTTLGAGMVFFLKGVLKPWIQKLLLGFASGVMMAASVWSLLIPSIEEAGQQGALAWLPAAAGFLSGVGFLLLIDSLVPHLHPNSKTPEGLPAKMKRSTMLILAVTIHNVPEGMAVGVVFAGVMSGNDAVSLAGAMALSLGIAIQNFPEGTIVSAPLRAEGMSRAKAFLFGTLSGVVEPIAALITIALTSLLVPAMPFLLAFAAGAMIYVVVEELIPGLQEGGHSNIGVVGVAVGFVLMMCLDVALG